MDLKETDILGDSIGEHWRALVLLLQSGGNAAPAR